MNKDVSIGVDIGGSHILSAAVDPLTGTIDEKSRAHVAIDNKASVDRVMSDWASCLNKTIEAIREENILGIGFAMPGPFNYKEGIALFEGNDKYERLYGLEVDQHLRPLVQTGEVPFRYHNDATCFAMGVDGYGVAKAYDKSISITLGTGFGSAFIDHGVPIVVREDVPKDGCLWHLPFKKGIADDYFSTRWFVKSYEARFGKRLPGVKEIAALYNSEDGVKEIFDTFGRNLAEFMGEWISKFKPEVIVIGGNISGAYDLFSPALYAALNENNLQVDFKVSQLKEDAALFGSARLVNDSFYSKLKDQLPTK